ncbi:Uncharacterised protein [Weeksella virosa]|nr:Uncharacterised protein [Weeksella virosa]
MFTIRTFIKRKIMKKNTIFGLSALLILLVACEKKENSVQETPIVTETVDSIKQDSVQPLAEQPAESEKFQGKLGNSSNSITYTITLNPDESYIYQTKDDKTGEVLITTGVYDLKDDGKTLLLGNISDGPNAFRIEGDKLIEVDKNGNPKVSNGEVHYILIKK